MSDIVAEARRVANLLANAGHRLDDLDGDDTPTGTVQTMWNAADRLRELAGIVAKLPVTADGVRVVPGTQLWHRDGAGRVTAWSNPVVAVSDTKALGVNGGIFQRTDVFYSTREAAERSRQ